MKVYVVRSLDTSFTLAHILYAGTSIKQAKTHMATCSEMLVYEDGKRIDNLVIHNKDCEIGENHKECPACNL